MVETFAKYDPTLNGGAGQDKTNTPPDLAKNRVNATFMNELDRGMAAYGDRIQDAGRGNAQVASAAAPDIGASGFDIIHITGAVGISGFASADPGTLRELIFDSTPVLTHHATALNLPGAANITAAAGDRALMRCEGNGAYPGVAGTRWTCTRYTRADGMPVGRRGVADGAADDGVLEIKSDNALATAGDYLFRAKNQANARFDVDFAGLEYRRGTRVTSSVPRSELQAGDFDNTDVTVDGAFHDVNSGGGGSDERLDCSGIITDVDARMADIQILFRSAAAGEFILFTGEEDASANTTYNRVDIRNEVANKFVCGTYRITLPSDGSRKLSYLIGANVNYMIFTIIDWGV